VGVMIRGYLLIILMTAMCIMFLYTDCKTIEIRLLQDECHEPMYVYPPGEHFANRFLYQLYCGKREKMFTISCQESERPCIYAYFCIFLRFFYGDRNCFDNVGIFVYFF
jgi:hypothetical protein